MSEQVTGASRPPALVRLLDRGYRRWGIGYPVAVALATGLILAGLSQLTMVIFWHYLGVSVETALVRGLPVVALWGLAGLAALAVISWIHRDLFLWAHTKTRGSADPQALAAHAFAAWRQMTIWIPVAIVPASMAVFVSQLIALEITGTLELALAVAGTTSFGLLAGLVIDLAGGMVFRPVLADLSRVLPLGSGEADASAGGLARRMLAVVFLTIFITGAGVGGLSSEPGQGAGALFDVFGIDLLLSLTLGLALALLLTESVVGPIRSLVEGTARVARGRFDEDVPVVTRDEIGVLVGSFNRMQEGLRERERLATENANLLEEVRASRARLIAATDAERARVERDIHDGAQQQLAALALELRLMQSRADATGQDELGEELSHAATTLSSALAELRELARSLHPQILSTSGLGPAVAQIAARSPVDVSIEICQERFEDQVESTAYTLVAAVLENVAEHSPDSEADVSIARTEGKLLVTVTAGTSVGVRRAGLADRVEAIGGELTIEQVAGRDTRVVGELPITDLSTARVWE